MASLVVVGRVFFFSPSLWCPQHFCRVRFFFFFCIFPAVQVGSHGSHRLTKNKNFYCKGYADELEIYIKTISTPSYFFKMSNIIIFPISMSSLTSRRLLVHSKTRDDAATQLRVPRIIILWNDGPAIILSRSPFSVVVVVVFHSQSVWSENVVTKFSPSRTTASNSRECGKVINSCSCRVCYLLVFLLVCLCVCIFIFYLV